MEWWRCGGISGWMWLRQPFEKRSGDIRGPPTPPRLLKCMMGRSPVFSAASSEQETCQGQTLLLRAQTLRPLLFKIAAQPVFLHLELLREILNIHIKSDYNTFILFNPHYTFLLTEILFLTLETTVNKWTETELIKPQITNSVCICKSVFHKFSLSEMF